MSHPAGKLPLILADFNLSVVQVQQATVILRQSDEDAEDLNIKSVHDVSVEFFHGANFSPGRPALPGAMSGSAAARLRC